MKKNLALGLTALVVVLAFAACGSSPTSGSTDEYTAAFNCIAAIKAGDIKKAENILQNNKARETFISHLAVTELYGDKTLQALQLLSKYNVLNAGSALLPAFEKSQPDAVIDFILPHVKKISADQIRSAIAAGKFKYVPRLISLCDDLNTRSSRTDKYWADNPDQWSPDYSKTPLIKAAEKEHLATVKLLVEAGANVNIRAEDGSTAASIAYDNGNTDIYDYLIAHGARDFTPRQAAAQPAQPVQQSAPSYQAPAQSAPAQRPAAPTLQPGTYAYSGSNITISLTSMGTANLMAGYNVAGQGSYRISGNQIAITISYATGAYSHLSGVTWAYTITSNTSFSGSGENWVRTGY